MKSLVGLLEKVPSHFRCLLLHYQETSPEEALVTPQSMVALGQRVLRLAGLFVLLRAIEGAPAKVHSAAKKYLDELMLGNCPYSPGYAADLVNLASQMSHFQADRSLVETFRRQTLEWLEVVAKSRATTREKEWLYLRAKIHETLGRFFESFVHCFQHELQLRTSGKGTRPFLIFPMLIQDPLDETEGHLTYGFDLIDIATKEVCYENWPTRRTVRLASRSESAAPELGSLWEFLNAFRPKPRTHRSRSELNLTNPIVERSIIPLLADSRPAILKLADLLLEKTESQTQWKLWGAKCFSRIQRRATKADSGPRYSVQAEPSSAIGRADWLNRNKDALREQIVLDCIENDPIRVLLNVANQEGRSELVGYVEQLAGDQAPAVLKSAERASGYNYGGDSPDHDENPTKIQIFQRVLAIEVARKLGFNVTQETALKGIRFYMNEVQNFEALVATTRSLADLRSAMIETAIVLERVLKDLCLFYRYLHPAEETVRRLHSERFPDGSLPPQWVESVEKVERWPLGTLVKECKQLLDDRLLLQVLQDRINIRRLVGGSEIEKALGEGTNNYVVTMRNSIPHDKSSEDPEKSKLADAFKRRDLAEVRECAIVFMRQVDDFLNLLMDEGNSQRDRIYPYKMTFTVYSVTAYGIQKCNYYTDACDEMTTADTLIYTDEPVVLGKVYYCLPHRDRQSDRVWVDPLLLETDKIKASAASTPRR